MDEKHTIKFINKLQRIKNKIKKTKSFINY